jgi:succinate dehydrogenase / fumarate reductase cytochrome b subunit
MNWFTKLVTSSLGKKVIMALTGLFLISFLVIHVTINSMIFFNDGGAMFSHWGHFMGTNPIIRFLEIGLVAGFLIHIFQGFALWRQNRAARPEKYKHVKHPEKSKWYSRSMGLLGTIILLFLIMHTAHFWIPNRASQGLTHWEDGEINLYAKMFEVFSSPLVVILYLVGCFSLFWHLFHGFKSAFQSLGLNHMKYNGVIDFVGTVFSIIVPILFALMPIAIYFSWISN